MLIFALNITKVFKILLTIPNDVITIKTIFEKLLKT